MSNGFVNTLLPLFLLAIFGASYIIYMYCFCIRVVTNIYNRIAFSIIISFCTVMFLWSFFATMFSSVGKIPIEYKFTREEHTLLMDASTNDDKDDILETICQRRNILVQTTTITGSIRYCITCMHIKPDRTHHCTNCGVCFLKMDHHCPWMNNCIGFRNYKSFILLIFYTSLYCFCYVSSTIRHIIYNLDNSKYTEDLPISVGFGAAVIMGIVTLGFLFYHFYLIGKNETTLENVHPPYFVDDDLTFDLGIWQNIVEVFGKRWYLWFLPVFSSIGNGHIFLVERK